MTGPGRPARHPAGSLKVTAPVTAGQPPARHGPAGEEAGAGPAAPPGCQLPADRRPVPQLGPPGRFAGGVVVAAARVPVDASLLPWRHVIVVRHDSGGRQSFSVHEVAHDRIQWTGGQGRYDLRYTQAIRLMAEMTVGPA